MKKKNWRVHSFFYTCFYTRQILTLKIERCCHLFLLDLGKQIPWEETRWISLASTHLSESFTSSPVKMQLSQKDSFQRRQEFCINRYIHGRKWRHALEDPAQPSLAQRHAWRRMDVWCSATTRPTQHASWADDLITILRTTRSSTWNGIPITQVSCAPGSDHRPRRLELVAIMGCFVFVSLLLLLFTCFGWSTNDICNTKTFRERERQRDRQRQRQRDIHTHSCTNTDYFRNYQ